MKIIVVTGVPGTGKTTIAKKLADKLNFYYFDVNKFITKNKIYEGYDRKRRTKVVDINKLNKKLIEVIDFFKKNNKLLDMPYWQRQEARKTAKKENITKSIKKYNGLVIDSHLSHYLPRKYVDLCIVAKCDIKELNKRLKKKKFNRNKIMENLQAEIFGVCYNEAVERKHNIIVINTAKSFNISSLANKLGGF